VIRSRRREGHRRRGFGKRVCALRAFAASLAILLGTAAVNTSCSTERPAPPPIELPPAGPITIALAGDLSFTALDGVSSPAFDRLRGATIGVANLEVNLLDADRARAASARPAPRWLFAPAAMAPSLRALGFAAVSLANNHAMDFGPDGLTATERALDAAAIMHAGSGADLAAARAPAFIGRGARRVAFIAVTASASDQSRASPSQSDIQGRAGVSPLLFDAAITVDAATYRTLADSVSTLQAGPPPGDRTMTMFGRQITKGDTTHVEFTLNGGDEQQLLAVIREARRQSELVVVSVHSHEPFNGSEAPAPFLQQFAHDAVNAGAQLIVGHGPHRIRGVEIYNGAPIFYSLGNFIYQTADLDFRAADPFDAGTNLYTAAIGGSDRAPSPFAQLEQAWWWESLLVVATSEGGTLSDVKVYPVTLNRSGQPAEKGLPQLAEGLQAETILRRFSALSRLLGTETPEQPVGAVLDLPIPRIR
jgi:poly-gamma-glutamate capsule biosynthesis protein CapA/YwtB (metallophosphatase superfamily)